jgi:membrane protein
MVLGLGFLLLISMVITTAVEAMASGLGSFFPLPAPVVAILSGVVSFLVVGLFFALLFKFLPDVKVPWRAVWVGATATAVLFTAGRYLLSLYLGREATSSSYGAAGSVVVLLLWVYYSTLILFVGAEFTQVYAARIGVRLSPAEYAVPVTEEARAQEGMPHANLPSQKRYAVSVRPLAFGAGILAGWWLGRTDRRKRAPTAGSP